MIKLLKNTIEYIGVGVFLLGVIIVYATLSANGFNGYILGTGILLMAIPVIVYLIIEKTGDKGAPEDKLLSDLKLTGIEIPVDLTKCVVKSNQWTSDK